jgi:hypothetical protein
MARNQVAIRLGVEGSAEVKRSFDEVGQAGERAAQRLGQKFQQQSALAEQSAQKAAQTAGRIAQISNVTPTQQRIAAVTGIDRQFGDAGAARASAAAFQDLERRSEALRAAIDPTYAAQKRFNAGLVEARGLLAAGAISTREFEAAQERLKAEYAQATAVQTRATESNRLATIGYQQLGFQASDVVAQLATGTNVMVIFAQQAGQVAQAIALIAEGKVKTGSRGDSSVGGLAKEAEEAKGAYEELSGAAETLNGLVGGQALAEEASAGATATDTAAKGANSTATGANSAATNANTLATEANAAATTGAAAAKARFATFLAGPWFTGIMVGVTALGFLVSALGNAEESTDSLLQKQKEQFAQELLQRAADDQYRLSLEGRTETVRELIEANKGLLKSEEAIRAEQQRDLQHGANRARQLVPMAERYLKQKEEDDTQSRGGWAFRFSQEMQDSARAVREQADALERHGLTVRDMTLPQLREWIAEQREILELAPQVARAMEIQPFLESVVGSAKEAGEEAVRLTEQARKEAERRAEQSARTAQALRDEASAAMEVARAYSVSIAAGRAADANAGGEHGALRLRAGIAQEVASGSRSAAEMNFEAVQHERMLAILSQETDGWRGLEAAQGRLAVALPLLRLETVAEGEEQARLAQVIENLTSAYDRLEEAKRNAALGTAIGTANDALNDARALAPFLGDPAAERVERARIAANREADKAGWKGEGRAQFVQYRVEQADQENDDAARQARRQRLDRLAATRAEGEDALRLLALEGDLLGVNDRERSKQLRLMQLSLQLNREFGPEYNNQKQQILDIAAAEEDRRAALERAQEVLGEIQQVGERVIDTIFDPSGPEDWGDRFKLVIEDLMQDLLRLAALNPLKNMLLGTDHPEIGGFLGKLLGFGAKFAGAASGGGVPPGFGPSGGVNISDFFADFGTGGYATGTENFAGGIAMVGENGKEMVHLPTGSRITPAAETRRLLGSANDNRPGSVTVNVYAQDAVLADTVRGWVSEGMSAAAAHGAAGGAMLSAAESSAAGARQLGRRW